MFSFRLCLLLLPSACLCLVALNNDGAKRPSKEVREPESRPEDFTLDAPKPAPTTPDIDTSLAGALRALRRRKREISGTHRPYSAYHPLSTHRYRYPLYRKRSIYPSEDYFNDEDVYLSNEGPSLSDWDEYEPEKPSLFRERERGPSQKLISNAHFSTKTLYNKREMPNNRQLYPQIMPIYNLDSSDYNLSPINMFYEPDKRASNSPTRSRNLASPRSSKLRDINEVSPLKLDDQSLNEQDEAYANLLKAAIEEYKRYGPLNNAMTRRKRAVSMPLDMPTSTVSNPTSKNQTRSSNLGKLPMEMGISRITKASDRQKRAYKALPAFLDPRDEARRDFLTREYFKTIARSVGNKRKKMAYAQFQAPKRNRLDTFLENPEMLKFVRKEIRDAEKEVAKDAQVELEEDIGKGQILFDDLTSQEILRNVIARLDALERMREALYQLERIQEQEAIQKRAQNLVGEIDESEKGKRRKSPKSKLQGDGQEEEERLKRKEDAIHNILDENTRNECPILERIVQNCLAVTEMVTDEDKIFLEPCLRHEVCYMCGAGVDVSQHECDALFSAGLETGCSGAFANSLPTNGPPSLSDCLSAAGNTYTLLGDPTRYDDRGTCTYDPCVRQLLEER